MSEADKERLKKLRSTESFREGLKKYNKVYYRKNKEKSES